MINLLDHKTLVAIPIIIALINTIQLIRNNSDSFKNKFLTVFFLFLPYVLNSILAYYLLLGKDYPLWAYITLGLIFTTSIFRLLEWNEIMKINETTGVILVFIPVLILISVTSFIVIINKKDSQKLDITIIKKDSQKISEAISEKKIDISSINKSFKRIQQKYFEIDEIISFETKEMDQIIMKIYTRIQEKNEELKEIRTEYKILEKELEYYKTLKSLSEKDVQAITYALHKNKHLDYLIGGIIGFLVSLLVAFITSKENRKAIRKSKT